MDGEFSHTAPFDLPLNGYWQADSVPGWDGETLTGQFLLKSDVDGWTRYYHCPYILNPDSEEEEKEFIWIGYNHGPQFMSAYLEHSGLACAPGEYYFGGGDPWRDRTHMDRTKVFYRGLFDMKIAHEEYLIDIYMEDFFVRQLWDDWDSPGVFCAETHVDLGFGQGDVVFPNHYDGWLVGGNKIRPDGGVFWYTEERTVSGPVFKLPVLWDELGIASIGQNHIITENVHVVPDYYCPIEVEVLAEEPTVRDFRLYVKQDNPLEGFALEVWDEINRVKAENGEPEVVFNMALYEAAKRHADDFAANEVKYWTCPDGEECHVPGTGMPDAGHIGTDGSNMAERVYGAGYHTHVRYYDAEYNELDGPEGGFSFTDTYLFALENVNSVHPHQTAAECVQEWMDSPYGHADAILNNVGMLYPADESGLAVAYSANYVYVVQLFGYRDRLWPGFAARNTDAMVAYMDGFFTWPETEDKTRLPKVYLT